MKTESDKRRLRLFMGSLALVALLINCTFIKKEVFLSIFPKPERQELGPTEQAAAQKALKDAAEQAKYVARYVNTGFVRKPGIQSVAVAVANEDKKLNLALGTALASHFRTNTVEMFTYFFKPAFVSDGLLAGVLGGSTEVLDKLKLTNSLDTLLLARQGLQFSTNVALGNLISAHMNLELVILPASGNLPSQAWTFAADGAGFNLGEARLHAEERLIQQVSNDTNMSLNEISPSTPPK